VSLQSESAPYSSSWQAKSQRWSKAPPQAAVEVASSMDGETAGCGLTGAKPVLRLAMLIPPKQGE